MREALSITSQPVVSLTDRVFEALEEAIVRCDLNAGEVVTDRTLSARLNVSRTPVREALQRLAATGLVVPRHPGPGWEIAGFNERDLSELFELRKALEPLGLRALLSNETDEAKTIHDLGTFFDDFDDPVKVDDYPKYFQRDHEFHKGIVACTGNSRVIGFYEIVEKQIDRGRHFLSTGYQGRIEENLAEHKRITNAIANRDLDGAIDALLYHFERGEELMARHIKAERDVGRL